jgi:hypothetical protein
MLSFQNTVQLFPFNNSTTVNFILKSLVKYKLKMPKIYFILQSWDEGENAP